MLLSPAAAHADAGRLSRDPVARLACDLRELTAEYGCATEADLHRRGWTPDALARHIHPAREAARARLDEAEAAPAQQEAAR